MHVAWGESSAVLFVNSVLGARTNREGGPTGLAAGMTGRTPEYGYHLDENRYGELKINVTVELKGETDYSTLGYFAGKIAQEKVPIFTGIPPSVFRDELKYLGAGLATSGSVSLYHVISVTPDAPTEEAIFGPKTIGPSDTYEFGQKELKDTEESLCSEGFGAVDVVILGCPHVSIIQIRHYVELLSGRRVKDNVEIWILVSNVIKHYAEDLGYARALESSGCRLVSNTCPSPMPRGFFNERGFRAVATESAKMAFYVAITQNVRCRYGNLDEIIDAVTVTR
jgi:predicted aconitase